MLLAPAFSVVGRSGQFVLAGRVRGGIGRVRVTQDRIEQIKMVPETADLAKERVRAEVATRVSFALTDALSPDTTVTELFELRLKQLSDGTALNPVRPQTVDIYETALAVFRGRLVAGSI